MFIGSWAVTILNLAANFCIFIFGSFLSKLPELFAVILGCFVVYTIVRVVVSRILGSALGSASDSVKSSFKGKEV